MTGPKVLLLLAALLSAVRCRQTPTVTMLPKLIQVFIGDLFHLHCNPPESSVKWFLDGKPKGNGGTLTIAAASLKDNGTYICKSQGIDSEGFSVSVLEYAPSASLIIETGHPVMGTGSSVILRLEHEAGLKGWFCRVNRGSSTKRITLKVDHNPVSLPFQPNELSVPETIFWCIDSTEKRRRSNQVLIRTTDKRVSLEMYPLPVMAGESLTLRCLVWGTNEIFSAVFYKNGTVLQTVQGAFYKIDKVTESQMGRYKCDATYRYKDQSVPPHKDTSDVQEVLVHGSPIRAQLSQDMSCSCPSCDNEVSYRYYKNTGDDSWTVLERDKKPDSRGTYRCRAVMTYKRTLLSHDVFYEPMRMVITIVLLLVGLIVVSVALVGCYVYHRRRKREKGAIYEDVALKLHGDAKTERRGGEYEVLKKEEMKEAEYDMLRMEGASGGDGGYQELKKQGRKEAEYDTLKTEGAPGGDGGYQELKKQGRKEAEYDTLKTEGAPGGDGGYQELKKQGRKEDVYHSLGDHLPGAGGDGGYEPLKKEGIQKSEYETLKTKDAEERPGQDTKTTK